VKKPSVIIFSFILLVLAFAGYESARSQDTGSGLDFLNIGPSPRMLSVSEASTALLSGPSSIYSNPSLLSFETGNSLDVSYTLWVANVSNQFAGVHFKRDRLSYGLAVYASQADEFEARNQPGPPAGTFSISYFSLAGSVAYRTGPLSVGVTGQFLREEIFQLTANGYAFNVGTALNLLNDRLLAGVSLNNLGEMEELDVISTPLPATFRAGISGRVVEFTTPGRNDFPVLLSLAFDWTRPLEEASGGDFTPRDADESFYTVALVADAAGLFSIQSGYRFGPTERPVSFGAGMIIDPIRINYALVPFSTGYGTVHSFGIEYRF
jgi:hypothetical protein